MAYCFICDKYAFSYDEHWVDIEGHTLPVCKDCIPIARYKYHCMPPNQCNVETVAADFFERFMRLKGMMDESKKLFDFFIAVFVRDARLHGLDPAKFCLDPKKWEKGKGKPHYPKAGKSSLGGYKHESTRTND